MKSNSDGRVRCSEPRFASSIGENGATGPEALP